MEAKKISFGFMKTKKQDKPIVTEQREYIESVEENSIKIIGKELSVEAEPLIIPMKPNTLITSERLKEIALKVESSINEPNEVKSSDQQEQTKQLENETLEQMATRELLQEAKKEVKMEAESLKISVPSLPVIEGQKESSLEDYEAVPIQDFGMAMLRGMGWTPGKEMSKYKMPNLRPKGLGLGADKVVTENQKKNQSKDNDKDLEIVKNAFVKITTGKYTGCYGKVMSLDEDNGRVLVNIPIKKDTVSLSEFMMHPVTKSEFEKQSKVINADSYEAYKKNEADQKSSERSSKKDNGSSSNNKFRYADKSDRSESKHADKPDRNESRNADRNDKSDSRYGDKSDRTESRYTERLDRNESRYIDRSDRNEKRVKSGRNDDSQKRDSEKHSNGRNIEKDISSEEEDHQHKVRERKRYSSDSASSEADIRKSKANRDSSSCSEKEYKERDRSSSRRKKKDIDKKRKGKKKKRDRDRSPGYRKHRK